MKTFNESRMSKFMKKCVYKFYREEFGCNPPEFEKQAKKMQQESEICSDTPLTFAKDFHQYAIVVRGEIKVLCNSLEELNGAEKACVSLGLLDGFRRVKITVEDA